MTTKPGDITKAAIVADSNIDVIQWNQNLNFHAKKASKTAEEFLPTVPGDWTSAPATQDAALNELGARSAVGAETSTANIFTENQTLANAKALILKELTTNGTGSVAIKAPDSVSGNTAFILEAPAANGTIALTSDIGAAVSAVAEVALTQAEITGLYAASKLLVAAPVAGHILIVDSVEVLHTYAVAAYTDGGAVVVQYGSTVNGAGVEAAPIAIANVTAGASSCTKTDPAERSEFDMVANKAKGLYLGNKTQAFAAGNAGNVIKVRVYYRDIILPV